MDFITEYAWILWLALVLVFVIVEMLSLELTFLMLALGSLGGLLSGLFGAQWWLQILIAGVLAVILLGAIRPALLKALRSGSDPTRSNVDALLGLEGRVLAAVGETGGLVKLSNGDTWTARLSPTASRTELKPGDSILVAAIDGATALVVPEERT